MSHRCGLLRCLWRVKSLKNHFNYGLAYFHRDYLLIHGILKESFFCLGLETQYPLCVSKLPVPRKEKVYSTKEEACRKGKMIKNPKNLKGKVKCKRQALIDQWSKLTLTMRKIIILDDSDMVSLINQEILYHSSLTQWWNKVESKMALSEKNVKCVQHSLVKF